MLRMCDEPVPPELNKVSHDCCKEKDYHLKGIVEWMDILHMP